jgi:hypothetical protein
MYLCIYVSIACALSVNHKTLEWAFSYVFNRDRSIDRVNYIDSDRSIDSDRPIDRDRDSLISCSSLGTSFTIMMYSTDISHKDNTCNQDNIVNIGINNSINNNNNNNNNNNKEDDEEKRNLNNKTILKNEFIYFNDQLILMNDNILSMHTTLIDASEAVDTTVSSILKNQILLNDQVYIYIYI